ncbi:MAG: hypothetical protein ACI399_07425 [Candidatus Cryptobacteroides sp.]
MMKHIAGKVPALAAFLVLALSLCGCGASKIKDIEVTSFGIESCTMRGLRSLEAVIALGIDNPALEFAVTGLEGIIRYNGEDFATYTADSLRVAARCASVYDLRCTATLSDGVTLKQLLALAGNRSLEGMTTDLEATVTLRNGVGKKFRFKNLDIGKMMEKQQ